MSEHLEDATQVETQSASRVGKVKPRKGGGFYHFNCVCGAAIVTANKVGVCFDCEREYRVDWDGKLETQTQR